MEIGKTIQRLRLERNIKKKELAKLTDISTTALYNIEHDCSYPSPETLKKICDALKVSVPCFFLYAIDEKDVPEDKRLMFNMFMNPLRQLLSYEEDNSNRGE